MNLLNKAASFKKLRITWCKWIVLSTEMFAKTATLHVGQPDAFVSLQSVATH
jgi:hypothetical protein